MAFVSVTRLRLRSWRFLLPFLRASRASIGQAVAASGFRGGATLFDRKLTFWTCTVWESERDMKAYRGAGAHRDVMPYLRVWCSEAVTTNWTQPEVARPTWPEAWRRLQEQPRWHQVDHPGPAHLARDIRPPSTAAWRDGIMRQASQ